ncbi:MAG: Asp-tRNA(Asn)/Glu-tRNA(Gln) amidotransferase GatCAB subunit B [Phototrophicales bacterium]|nr:MAG: Asp-tRNA(Asn)/Glu-tRNA(Gln) amidotransferase GatCAB subunit B [Phototrophicales bacterium]RMG77059.1 MAG: Asp-tRNA(Asn)/Glu-tRNA(Gln) amidotransferase subunit GatB [Chloroflexota bacterium]
MSEWTPIIGLEVHAEMLTRSKMFSACPVVDSVEAAPNTAVDPLSLGMPGTLPVINQLAMEYGLMVGLALNCEIPPFNQFARKSYFYPDLPKGYQISQYQYPLAVNGYIDITLENGDIKRIGITRAHMEEDTGKLTHVGHGASLVDYNRAGVPLLEIVSEPDIRSSAEAEAYARKLRAILQYLGVNHGDMSKGILRFEANVSVMHKDDKGFRTRTEIKNLNSIRSMVRAIDYEIARQIKLYESGDTVKPATLGWDEQNGKILIQRYKERADEYRYFPEPDLPIVEMQPEYVESVRQKLPELPDAKKARFMDVLGLSEYDARQLVAEQAIAHFYEDVLAAGADAKSAANWILVSLFSLFNKEGVDRETVNDTPISAANLAELVKLVDSGTINKGTGEKVLSMMWQTGDSPQAIVEREGLAQVSDEAVIGAEVDKVLAANAGLVDRFLAGEQKLFGALVGKVMGAFKGRANAQVVNKILQDKINERKS